MIQIIRHSFAGTKPIKAVETVQEAKQVLKQAALNCDISSSFSVRNMATNKIVTSKQFLKQGFAK